MLGPFPTIVSTGARTRYGLGVYLASSSLDPGIVAYGIWSSWPVTMGKEACEFASAFWGMEASAERLATGLAAQLASQAPTTHRKRRRMVTDAQPKNNIDKESMDESVKSDGLPR